MLGGARVARSPSRVERSAPRSGTRANILLGFPLRTLTCSSGFGIFRSPPHRGGNIRISSVPFRSEENTMAKKKAKKAGKKRKPNAAFMKAMTPSATLASVIGSSAMPRTEVTKKIWGYIKRNGLQDKKNRRMINADDKLKAVFGGKSQVSMFEMTKLVSKHLK
jgi:upstream activation factor subunit UAF30